MIALTRMDKQLMYINPDHIVSIEETPDTVITLFNGNHYIVKERADIIISRIVAFRARILRRCGTPKVKKYLQRQQISQFQRVTIEKEAICPVDRDKYVITPFHSRDF
ncbi:MAG: flagellar FlbD family protein [Desulfuromonadaceae bacterium]|nr:flagellar FlbD family protein [Desulfuromonadaceae bacterium]